MSGRDLKKNPNEYHDIFGAKNQGAPLALSQKEINVTKEKLAPQ